MERVISIMCASLLNRDSATSLDELEADHNTNALEVVRNFSETQIRSFLQGLSAMEDGGISLSGNYFPEQITYVEEKDQVHFQVPQNIGCNLEALTVRVVCSLISGGDMSPSRNSIFLSQIAPSSFVFVLLSAQPIPLKKLHMKLFGREIY